MFVGSYTLVPGHGWISNTNKPKTCRHVFLGSPTKPTTIETRFISNARVRSRPNYMRAYKFSGKKFSSVLRSAFSVCGCVHRTTMALRIWFAHAVACLSPYHSMLRARANLNNIRSFVSIRTDGRVVKISRRRHWKRCTHTHAQAPMRPYKYIYM